MQTEKEKVNARLQSSIIYRYCFLLAYAKGTRNIEWCRGRNLLRMLGKES